MINKLSLGVQTTFIAYNLRSISAQNRLSDKIVQLQRSYVSSTRLEMRDRVGCVGPHLAARSPQLDLIRASHSTIIPALRGQDHKPGCTR